MTVKKYIGETAHKQQTKSHVHIVSKWFLCKSNCILSPQLRFSNGRILHRSLSKRKRLPNCQYYIIFHQHVFTQPWTSNHQFEESTGVYSTATHLGLESTEDTEGTGQHDSKCMLIWKGGNIIIPSASRHFAITSQDSTGCSPSLWCQWSDVCWLSILVQYGPNGANGMDRTAIYCNHTQSKNIPWQWNEDAFCIDLAMRGDPDTGTPPHARWWYYWSV